MPTPRKPRQAPAFSDLHPDLRKLVREIGLLDATETQDEAIPAIASGAHTLLVAPTGHGKTEAALLPIVDRFLRARDAYAKRQRPMPSGFKILMVTPLRALNRDMLRRVSGWGQRLGFTVGVRHSDTTQSERRRQALKPPDLLITTPETLQLLFVGRLLRKALATVRWVIVDEIHELAASDRGYQLAVALERLEDAIGEQGTKNRAVPSSFQRIGLSATIGNPEEVAFLLGGAGRTVNVVDVRTDKKLVVRVEHPRPGRNDRVDAARISATPEQVAVLRRIHELVSKARATLVFSNTRDGAELLSSRMRLYDPTLPIGVHHGSLSKQARIEAEEAYRDGSVRALICTSSLELGIDVGHTDLVIQHGSSRGVERMVQRVGRAGHAAGRTSHGVVLATSGEDAAESSVVARRAMARQLEPIRVRPNPLAVLANQLLHMTVETSPLDPEKTFRLLRRSAPFAKLERDTFDGILTQLDEERLVDAHAENGGIQRRGIARRYMIDNVGMIRDRRTYPVVEAVRRKRVGTLDEDFVLGYLEPGSRFIMSGRSWDVLEHKDEMVLVAEADQIGAIPSWQGEDLPVPWSVAQEVGAMRRAAADGTVDDLRDRYPIDEDALSEFVKEVQLNTDKDLVVATDRTIVVEESRGMIVVNACLGSRANQTLGRMLEALVAQRIGASVRATIDSYRIALESAGSISGPLVENLLHALEPESAPALARVVVRNAGYLRYHLVHAARKFGVLGRNADPSRFHMSRFVDDYRATPLFEEAVERLLWDAMDIEHVVETLERLRDGRFVTVRQRVSPMTRRGLAREQRMLSPAEADPSILLALKNRLEKAKTLLVCVVCGRSRSTTVLRTPNRPECAACSAIMVAPLHPNERAVARLVNKKKRSDSEMRRLRRAIAAAHLVATYGRPAVMALAGRGVGPETAARILGKQRDESELLKGVLAAEVQYARTRRFWD